jgi:hypothetical protein
MGPHLRPCAPGAAGSARDGRAGRALDGRVIGSVWHQRQAAAGIVLLHGIAPIPASARPGLAVQVHLAEDDPFAPRQATARWQADADRAGLAA